MQADESMQKAVEANLQGCLWTAKEILLKLSEETGELIRAVRKEGDKAIQHEIGDVLFAILALCIRLGVSSEGCLRISMQEHSRKLSKTWQGNYCAGELVKPTLENEMERETGASECPK